MKPRCLICKLKQAWMLRPFLVWRLRLPLDLVEIQIWYIEPVSHRQKLCVEGKERRRLWWVMKSMIYSINMLSRWRSLRLEVVEDPRHVGSDARVDAGPTLGAADARPVGDDASYVVAVAASQRLHGHQRASRVPRARVLPRVASGAHLRRVRHLQSKSFLKQNPPSNASQSPVIYTHKNLNKIRFLLIIYIYTYIWKLLLWCTFEKCIFKILFIVWCILRHTGYVWCYSEWLLGRKFSDC